MRDINQPMLWQEAVDYFENEMMIYISMQEARQGGRADMSLRRQSWNDWTDSLCKGGRISDWQENNWSQPPSCQ